MQVRSIFQRLETPSPGVDRASRTVGVSYRHASRAAPRLLPMTTVDIETLLAQDDLRSLIEACEHTGAIRAPEVHEIVETHELDGIEQEALMRELEKRGIEIVDTPAPEATPVDPRPIAVAAPVES